MRNESSDACEVDYTLSKFLEFYESSDFDCNNSRVYDRF